MALLKTYLRIVVFAALAALLFSCGEKEETLPAYTPKQRTGEPYFQQRGLLLAWDDVKTKQYVDWLNIARKYGFNMFSIAGQNQASSEWKEFRSQCEAAGIAIQFQEHMASHLMPRSYFATHPEYFRMDANGNRVKDKNLCPSSEEGMRIVYQNAINIASNYQPTDGKYYFWLDDGGDKCHCPDCEQYSHSEQALMIENTVIKALRESDPNAQLAHLAYAETTDAPDPKKVKPEEGIFLQFAPFYRNWEKPLSERSAVGKMGWTNGKYLDALKANLKVFPAETAQVLEYWLDESYASGWDKNNLVKIAWDRAVVAYDLKTYASYGIKNIDCYAYWINDAYYLKFRDIKCVTEYGKDVYNFTK